MERTDYLLIGGGAASVAAAAAIRAKDAEGRIVLVAGEERLPYDRPPLSKGVLRGLKEAEDAESKDASFYTENRIELRTGARATAIDRAARAVRLENGEEIGYERLLLATGARAKPPEFKGSDLPGVFTLWNAPDSLALRDRFTPEARVVVVGAGYIGIEGAAAALDRGAQVTIVDPGDQPWGKFASPATGRYVQRYLEERGATFLFGDEVTAVAQEGEHLRVALKNGGELGATTVLVGIGAELNVEIARESGFDMDPKHGVVADETLRTSDARVWVAGDVAGLQDRAIGKRWHAEHYLNAKWQGAQAGENMARDAAGETPEPYDRVPYFFSDILTTHMILRGDPTSGQPARLEGDLGSGEYVELYAREDGTLSMALAFSGDEGKLDRLSDEFERLFRDRPQVAELDMRTLVS